MFCNKILFFLTERAIFVAFCTLIYIETNKNFYVSKKLSDGTEYTTYYDGGDGTIKYVGKEYEYSNGKNVQVFYYPKDKQYDIVEESGDKYVRKTFDEKEETLIWYYSVCFYDLFLSDGLYK